MVVFAGRPAAEWTADARPGDVAALVERGFAVDCYGGGVVSHPRYYEAHERANLLHDTGRLAEVCAIYEEGIATGLGMFETKAPSWEEWNAALVLPVSIT